MFYLGFRCLDAHLDKQLAAKDGQLRLLRGPASYTAPKKV